MKKVLILIFIIIVGLGVYKFKDAIPDRVKNRLAVAVKEKNLMGLANVVVPGKCDQPFQYSIGGVDSRFNINQSELAAIAKMAENIWDSQTGKNLFEYNPDAPLKINLVFDERQQQTLAAETLEQKLEKLKLSDAGLKKQYDLIYGAYSKKVDAYNSSVKKYESKLNNYNKDVIYWNQQGGAPPDEYDKLQKRKKDVEAMFKDLEKRRKEINNLIAEMNALANKESQIAGDYNSAVATYRSKYGGSREFEKGIYNGQEINIYQFEEKSDLELTIAHELGHALGAGHVENPQSLMYYLMADQNMDNPKLTAEDMKALSELGCELYPN